MGMAAGVMYMMLCNDCFRNVYAYFLCRFVCTCIHHVHDAFVCGKGGGHLYCSAQLSMFNMEKRYRNRLIIMMMMMLVMMFT